MRGARNRDRVEPAAPAEPTPRQRDVRALAEEHAATRGPLLPVLHAIVETHGYVDDQDIPVVADVLNLSHAEVHGVVSFYNDFRRTPAPAHQVVLCRAEACQSVGAEHLYASTRDRYAAQHDVEVGQVFCLGNCALGPSGMVDGRLMGRLTADSLATALEATS